LQGRAGLQTGSLQGSRMIAARRTCVRRLEGMLSRWSASPGSSGLMLALLATMPAVAGVASAPPRRGARHVARIDRLALRGGAASPGSPGLMLAPLATGRSAPCRHRGRRGRSPHRHRSCAAARPPSAAPAGGGPQEGVSLITLHWRYRREQIMALAQRRRASPHNDFDPVRTLLMHRAVGRLAGALRLAPKARWGTLECESYPFWGNCGIRRGSPAVFPQGWR